MTNEEFSNEFDVLLSNNSIALDEYEKSVFLTKAQEDLVLELYNGKNVSGESFEETEENRSYLRNLIRTSTLTASGASGIDSKSTIFTLPDEVWFITYESATLQNTTDPCVNGSVVAVVPTTQDEYHRVKNNPFRGPNKNRVLRLDSDNGTLELISNYPIKEYLVRYLTKPSPIILVDLGEGLQINKESKFTECKLNSTLHRPILDRAVRLALASKAATVAK